VKCKNTLADILY